MSDDFEDLLDDAKRMLCIVAYCAVVVFLIVLWDAAS